MVVLRKALVESHRLTEGIFEKFLEFKKLSESVLSGDGARIEDWKEKRIDAQWR